MTFSDHTIYNIKFFHTFFQLCDSPICEHVMMKFHLRRVVTIAVFVTYITFFMIYIYSTIEHASSKSSNRNNLDVSYDISKPEEYFLPRLNSSDLKSIIFEVNRACKVRNLQTFGKLSLNAVVVVVQVHDRAYYLKELINSLEKARGISEILLVFSHDVYDDEINELIRKIAFCRVSMSFLPSLYETC